MIERFTKSTGVIFAVLLFILFVVLFGKTFNIFYTGPSASEIYATLDECNFADFDIGCCNIEMIPKYNKYTLILNGKKIQWH